MDNREFDIHRRKKIENVVLIICTLYSIFAAIMTGGTANGWLTYLIEASIVALWMIHLADFKSYRFRATMCSLMAALYVMLYCILVNTDMSALISATGLFIVVGLYELQSLLIFPLVSVTIVIVHHALSGCIPLSTTKEISATIMEIMAVYTTMLVVRFFIDEEEKFKVRLLDTIDELKTAERGKDDFLANVSHELRTPINTICGMSEVGMAEARSESTRENLEDIRNAGYNLLAVVNDILDYSQFSTGRIELDEDSFNISSVINDVVNMSIAKIGDKKIELILSCDPELPCGLIGDEGKLKRVMLNLIENAIKYTGEGYVIIDVGQRKEEYGVNLTVKIKDTGIGMRQENIGRIFADFTQLSSGRDRREGGIGLGLTISRAIIELMGGFLTVESKYGKGTEIQFTVPQRVSDATPIGSIDTRLQSVNIESFTGSEYRENTVKVTGRVHKNEVMGQMIMPNAHVMIVDDSFMNIKVLEGLLKPYRIKVTTALSGREAIEKLVSRDYDFIFMDHMMPEMDGVECVGIIRSKDIAYYKNVPIVALTANAVSGAREMFIAKGFNDFISKPIDISGLERMLRKYVPKDKISYADIDEEEVVNTEFAGNTLVIGDLDVKKGLLYCGNIDNYRNVLRVHATNGPDNIDRIRRMFAEKDIKNYTIYVHALKSSMASIGAETLSNMAKDMEQAGKENDLPYIETHHEELMAEYERVIALLLSQDAVEMEVSDAYMEAEAVPIEDDKLDKYISDFEDAAYTFVAANMTDILDELKGYSYNGHPLAPQLIAIRRKVEMSDYISAADALSSIRERYRNR